MVGFLLFSCISIERQIERHMIDGVPVGCGVSNQSMLGSRMPPRTISIRTSDFGLTYPANNLLSSSLTTFMSVCTRSQPNVDPLTEVEYLHAGHHRLRFQKHPPAVSPCLVLTSSLDVQSWRQPVVDVCPNIKTGFDHEQFNERLVKGSYTVSEIQQLQRICSRDSCTLIYC